MKLKKVVKICVGVFVFLTLPTLLFFCFLFIKYNQVLPQGTSGPQADSLAVNMLKALNYDAYKSTNYIEWTFKKRHHYKWNKKDKTCEVYWRSNKVYLDFNTPKNNIVLKNNIPVKPELANKLIHKAKNYFYNDSFWVVAPYKIFDEGATRSIVNLEDGSKGLLVSYTKGGATPGDSYLWILDSNNLPVSYKMWTSIIPIDGLEASWSDWKTTATGAKLPTGHKLLVLGLEIDNIKTK